MKTMTFNPSASKFGIMSFGHKKETLTFPNLTKELARRCSTCGKVFENENDKENIDSMGECLMCEKLRFER